MPRDSRRFPFLTQAADRDRLPVALLSGFLGSGKTTLVNALLRDPRMGGTAVAVNEFGDVPLDRELIDHGADRTVVMANGCLCCNLAGDMEEAVMRLFSRRDSGDVPRFQRLIIEPSGLSDPAPIAQAILRNPIMSRALRLEAIVTTVDALFAETQLAQHPETRKQAALADRLVLTKTDLATADAVERLRTGLRDHNPAAPILTASHGEVDAASLFPPSFFDPALSAPPPHRSGLFAESVDPGHTGRHAVVSLTADRPLRWRAFDDWLRTIRIGHAEQLLRVKGMLDIAGAEGPVVVQGVHHVLNAPVELDAWPGGERKSRLVLIADRVTIAAARESWAAALPGIIVND
ncbi:MAG: GTP-binding protein [Rhodopila sp.]|nr:GTP-binding protein [Rhodopila sp.]